MKLGELVNKISEALILPEKLAELEIEGLASDSRYARKGDLFFARQGHEVHGLDFAADLEAKGVCIIFYDGVYAKPLPLSIPCYRFEDLEQLIPLCAQIFYEPALATLSLAGITGTEGKTSVSQFTAKILKTLHQACGVIGTNGIGLIDQLKENTHTTPDLLGLYRSLADLSVSLEKSAFKPVVLEVTSHALDQKRISGLDFKVTTFTNLARDHLDYHKTLEAYAAAKKKLFFDYSSQASVLNIDDVLGLEIFTTLEKKQDRKLFPYGTRACTHACYLQIEALQLQLDGIVFELRYRQKSYGIRSHLYGHFNAHNLAAAVANLLALGYSMDDIVPALEHVSNVEGRMEPVKVASGAVAIVDYAHKPNALLQVLKSLHQHISGGKIYCIFGCGGNRDRGKRPLMAEIAEKNADKIIVTNDNPRTEDPAAIADEILGGFSSLARVEVILDRRQAIETVLKEAQAGDIVLIAGKGHETYQIVGHQKYHFSDTEIIHEFNKTYKL